MSAAMEPDAVLLPPGAFRSILVLVAEQGRCPGCVTYGPVGYCMGGRWDQPAEMFDGPARLRLPERRTARELGSVCELPRPA
jgi:hypothetical protein